MTTASSPAPVAPSTGLSVRAYLADWLAHARGRVRAVTFEGYEVLLRRHAVPALGELMLAEVRPLDLQRLYSQLLAGRPGVAGLSGGSVLNLHLVLTQAFGQAVRWQLLEANPAAGAQPPRPKRPPRIVVDQQLIERRLLDHVLNCRRRWRLRLGCAGAKFLLCAGPIWTRD